LRFLFWDFGPEASRAERHLEVNYELAARCRPHSQENLAVIVYRDEQRSQMRLWAWNRGQPGIHSCA
jgi:hypothetical protein